jgi:hypothetical protein
MLRWILALCLTACATGDSARRFPSADQLRQLGETPVAPRSAAANEREQDGWALAGPLPERFETVAHAGDTPWDALLSRAMEARHGAVFASESMHCAAREAGRFMLANGALPALRLRTFIASRCGSPIAELAVTYQSGKIPDGAADSEVLEHWHEGLEKWLAQALDRGPLLAGLWFGREGGRGVVMLALQPRRVVLDPLPFRPDPDGRVVLRGELLVATANLETMITQGRYGYAACTSDDKVKLPRFAVTCAADRADETARIEMGAFAAGRITGPVVVDLMVWPARDPDNAWRHAAVAAPAPTDAAPERALLSMVNDVRRQASLAPLALAEAESRTAAKVARHYFAAVFGLEAGTVADQVVLGLRAGWEVEGAVRIGHFAAGAVPSNDVAELLAAMLDRPSGRETLLASAARVLAVGAFAEAGPALASVVSSYEFLDENEARVERVLQRLTDLRRAAGRPAPRLVKQLEPDAADFARQIRESRSPRDAVEGLMRMVAEWSRGTAHGWVVEYLTADAMQLPREMIDAPSLNLVIAVASYKPRGEPWTRCVAVLVSTDETMAGRERQLAAR